MISNSARESLIKPGAKQSHLGFAGVQTVFLHDPKKVVAIKVALFVGVHTREGVVDGEAVGAGDFLFGKLDLLLGQEMGFE